MSITGTPTTLKASVATISDLQGLPDDAFADGDLAFVSDLGRTFQIRRASSATANSTSIADTYTGNGRWEIFGNAIIVEPTGDPVVDHANVQNAIDASAETSVPVLLGMGRFRFDDPLRVTSNTHLVGASKKLTILDFDIDGATVSDCGFVAGPGATWSSTTVAAINRVGARTLSITGLGNGTTLAQSYVQPAVGETVQATFASTAGLLVDSKVFQQGGGLYEVVSIDDATHATIRNLGAQGNAAAGATVSSAGSPALVGGYVMIRDSVSGSNFHGGAYIVRGISGAGPYTLTVERPVNTQFGVGDVVEWMADMVIGASIGNFTITGRAARAIEFLTVRECVLRDIDVRGWTSNGPSDLTVSFDTFSYRCLGEGLSIDAGSTVAGFGLESNEGTTLRRITVVDIGTGNGLRINDGCDCSVEDYFARGDGVNGWGLRGNPEVSGNGPERLSLVNIDIEGFGIGMELASAKEVTGVNLRVFNNTSWNVILSGTTTAKLVNVIASGVAAVTGVYVATFYTNYGVEMKDTAVALIKNIDTTDCKFGIFVGATCRLHLDGHTHKGASGSDGNAQQARLSTQGTVYAKNLDYSDWTSGFRAVQATLGTIFIAQSNFAGTNSFVGVVAIGAKVYLETSTFSGFTSSNNVDAGGAGEIVFGKGLAINPSVASGGKVNAGTQALSGATPVVVTVPTLLGLVAGGDSRIRLTLKTVGGIQGPVPIAVAGTNQFTLTGTAGDTSTWAWMVE